MSSLVSHLFEDYKQRCESRLAEQTLHQEEIIARDGKESLSEESRDKCSKV